ncbi:MAG: ATP-binding cassette domain-containing protein [Pseudomonadota bacterium]
MGSITAQDLSYALFDRLLFGDVSFHVKPGQHVALIGPNGSGKTTLLDLLAGRRRPSGGSVHVSAPFLYMGQFVGRLDEQMDIRHLMIGFCTPQIQAAARSLERAEARVAGGDGSAAELDAYSLALARWEEVGGYSLDVLWDACSTAAVGLPFAEIQDQEVTLLSGGEQKRLVLEALFRAEEQVLLLDEPGNFLDVEGKRWMEEQIATSQKTVLLVSHDRATVQATATRVVTLEGGQAWVHDGRLSTYAQARTDRHSRITESLKTWVQKREQLMADVERKQEWARRSPKFSARYHSAQARLAAYDRTRPSEEVPKEQDIRMRFKGSRSGVKVLMLDRIGVPGLFRPFSTEVFFGDRLCIVGSNGTGKSTLVRLIMGEEVEHTGVVRLGASVRVGYFSQIHRPPSDPGASLVTLLGAEGLDLGRAMSALRRYELDQQAQQRFSELSGGQQARFQLLVLEVRGANLFILDEPTDNLDLVAAEAMEEAIARVEGTVIAISHDRWFVSTFDRYLVFTGDGSVEDALEPSYDMVVPHLRQRLRAN